MVEYSLCLIKIDRLEFSVFGMRMPLGRSILGFFTQYCNSKITTTSTVLYNNFYVASRCVPVKVRYSHTTSPGALATNKKQTADVFQSSETKVFLR